MKVLYGKKYRRWRSALGLLLTFCLVAAPLTLGGLGAAAADTQTFDIGVNPESVTAELTADGVLTLSGVGDVKDFTPETAPFAGKDIKKVEIGGGVSALGDYVFYGCGSLTGELTLPDGVVSIGSGAFSGPSLEESPRFTLIRNEFTQAIVADKKESPSTSASPEPSGAPASSEETGSSASSAAAAEEDVFSELSSETEESETVFQAESDAQTEEYTTSQASPESQPVSQAGDGSAAAPSPTQDPVEPETQEDDGNQFNLQTLTEQRIGEDVFFPGSGEKGCFVCSAENGSFREAAGQAGYQEADRLVSAVFDCGEGEGGTLTKELPVKDGIVVLPEVPSEFTAPQGGNLFSYTFGGWVESLDEAGTLRGVGSCFQAGTREDLYFIAAWYKEVLVKISMMVNDGVMTLTVPEIEGYTISACRWQQCQLPADAEIPKDEELLLWEDITGAEDREYVRELQPGDEEMAFRCVLTIKKQSLFSLFSLNGEEDLALNAVSGVQAYAEEGQCRITLSPGTGTGNMDPVAVEQGDYGVVPDCEFEAPSGTNMVFNGWTDGEGNVYDPGEIVPMTADLALTAQWTQATIRYVNGTTGYAGRENSGQTASEACRFFVAGNGPDESGAGSDTRYTGAYTDFSSGTKYSNIVVVCGNTTLNDSDFVLGTANATITSADPLTGEKYNVTLTLNGNVFLEGDTRFENITVASQDGNLFAKGNQIYFGGGVSMTEEYSLAVYGAHYDQPITADTTRILATSGSFRAICGGGMDAGLTGDTSIQLSGTAEAGVLVGAGWNGDSAVTGSTEVLISGNVKAAAVAGGSRASGGSAGVTGGSHVMVGGNAHVEGTDKIQEIFGSQSIGFVAGSACTAGDSEGTGGNVRQGTLVEIRGNACVDGNVFGGDGGIEDPAVSQPDWIGTEGGTTVIISGSPTIGGGVYGGGSRRTCKGDSVVTITGGSIAGSVYGGGSQGNLSGKSSVAIDGGTIGGSVYGGGEEGTVDGSSGVVISDGSVKGSVFGGSKGTSTSSDTGKVTGTSSVVITGGSFGAVDDIGNPISGTGNIFGGGEYAATDGAASVTVGRSGGSGGFSIQGNVYGGGCQAPVGTSAVTVNEGEIKGSVFGAGSCETSRTGGTTVTVNGGTVAGSVYGGGELGTVGTADVPGSGTQVNLNGGTVAQSLFGAGKGDSSRSLTDGCVYGPAGVTITGGRVLGTVYGGGDSGTVGTGTLTGSGAGASMTVAVSSSTSVTMTGGAVSDSVFGGGAGSSSDYAFGAVFGNTAVHISGGTVTGGVYGGCNRAFISGDTAVNIKADEASLTICGTVFGGGNLSVTGSSEGELPTFQDICLVQGKAVVDVDGSGANSLSIGGSVCGSGNLTSVKDRANTKITIQNFQGSLGSLQRAGRADIVNSQLQLVGASDVTQTESQQYSLSQIDDLHLVDGSVLRVDRETRELAAIGNYVSGSEEASSDEENRSTLRVFRGRKIQIRNSDGAYGPVSGVLWLDAAVEEGVSGEAVGVSVQASPDTNRGNGTTDTGAFVKADTETSKDLTLVSGLIGDSHTYWQLGSKTFTVDQTIQAQHVDNGGTGLAEKTFSISTGTAGSTEFVVTQRVQSGSFFLVCPIEDTDGSMKELPAFDGSSGQGAGNTFALRIQSSDSQNTGAWSQMGDGGYVLTADESNNDGAPGIWKRGTGYPTTSGNGGEGEFTLSLLYDPSYITFSGGTVELTFKEYQAEADRTEENLESTTVLTLTIEGSAAGVVRQSAAAAGRCFEDVTGTGAVTLTNSGAATALFTTTYLPLSAGSENMRLALYEGTGETAVLTKIPTGTKIVLGDYSTENSRHYYMYTATDEDTGEVSLSRFSSMGGSGSAFYPGPSGGAAEITEKLLVVADFSECTEADRLAAGDYQLRLTHSDTETAWQAISFIIASVTDDDYSLELKLETQGNIWAVKATLAPTVPAADTRFSDGALIRLLLTDSSGNVLGFPGKTLFSSDTISLEDLIRSADGSVSFPVPPGTPAEVIMDFSDVPSGTLSTGTLYGVRAELRPRTGLQAETDAGEANCVSDLKTFTLEGETKPERALNVTLDEGGVRVVDVSEGEASINLTVSAQIESGDSLRAVIYRKEDPADMNSYTELENTGWCSLGSFSSGKAAAVVTVPEGTAPGTYRVMFRIEDVNGITVDNAPYNFIVE